MLYTFNPSNDLFTLTYIYEKGSGHDIALDYVSDLLSLSGTSDMTPEQISRAFYDLASESQAGMRWMRRGWWLWG